MTLRNIGWLLLVTGLLSILGAYLLLGATLRGDLPAFLMIYGVGATLAGPLLLASPGRRPSNALVLAAFSVLLVVIAGFVLALLAPDDLPTDGTVLGLPRRAAMVLLGVGLVPALILPWAYAGTAAREPLDPESVAAFVRECRAAHDAELDR